MPASRNQSYDLLRIICAIAVIILHVSSYYGIEVLPQEPYHYLIIGNIGHGITRFAVPCFVMISGAFLLSDKRNMEFKYFYKKSFYNIFIHVFICSIILFIYREGIFFIKNGISINRELLYPIKDFIKGQPFYHLWYMYMLIGLYALVPIIIRIKYEIKVKTFEMVTIAWLVWAICSRLTSNATLKWDIGLVFSFVGYLMAGNIIYQRYKDKVKRPYICFILSILFFSMSIILKQMQITNNILNEEIGKLFYNNFFPFTVAGSIVLFIGFSNINIKLDCSKLAKKTFFIYIFHAPIIQVIENAIITKFNLEIRFDPIWWIITETIIVFIISYVFSNIYIYLWGVLDRKFMIKEKLL